MKKRTFARFAVIFAAVVLQNILGITEVVWAANKPDTIFMYPNFGDYDPYLPSNVLYTSEDIWFEDWGARGSNLCMLDLHGLDEVIAEAVANTFEGGGTEDWANVYMNGADLSAQNINDLSAAGWDLLDVTYKYYRITTYMVPMSEGYAPRVAATTDETVDKILRNAGIIEEYGAISISGLNMPIFGVHLYVPEYSFLNRNPYVYKYIRSGNYFQYINQGLYSSSDKDVIEFEDVVPADGTNDGIYIAINNLLPEMLTVPSSEPPTITGADGESELAVWQFDVEQAANEDEMNLDEFLNSFDGGLTVDTNEQKDVVIDFAYSGVLPAGTTVSLSLQDCGVAYENGTTLYFYYCNPDTAMNDYVGSSVYEDGRVTFDIYHCSQYIVTANDHGESFSYELEAESIAAEESRLAEEAAKATEEEITIASSTEDVAATTGDGDSSSNGGKLLVVVITSAVVLAVVCGVTVTLVIKRKKAHKE